MKRLFVILILLQGAAMAQLWSGVLDPTRAIDWTTAGAGTIPTTRTQCGSTIAAGATRANINSAIAACGANQYVLLGAGTFNLSGGEIDMKSNVTLRGAGPDQTLLVFASCGSGNGLGTCIFTGVDGGEFSGAPGNTANWTAGYAKGTTSITLSSVSNLHIGSLLILDGTDGTQTDPGDAIWVCVTTTCSEQGLTGISGRSGRAHPQRKAFRADDGSAAPEFRGRRSRPRPPRDCEVRQKAPAR
jgi:hypothetical protein